MCDSIHHVDALRHQLKRPTEVVSEKNMLTSRISMQTSDGRELEWSVMFGWQPSLEEIRKRTTQEDKSWPDHY